MKKTLSVFLSLVMLLSCLCFGSITAQAAEKKTNITYLYEPESQTLYIRGKGVIPEKFLGWDTDQYEDYLESELYAQEGYVLSWLEDDGEIHTFRSREMDDEINLRRIYPEPYVSITRHVKKLVIEEGITRISRFAFSYSFPNLQKVVFPSTLRSIADCAFAICKMDCVVFPANLETVDNFAFDANVSNCIFLGKKTKVSDLRVGDLAKHVYCYAGSAVEKQCKANLADKNPDIRKVNYSTIKTPAQVSGVKASTTGSTALSSPASARSLSSRGSTLGLGKLSITSACLLAMALNSHPEVGSTWDLPRPRMHSQWRSLYHWAFSTTRRSRFALPSL